MASGSEKCSIAEIDNYNIEFNTDRKHWAWARSPWSDHQTLERMIPIRASAVMYQTSVGLRTSSGFPMAGLMLLEPSPAFTKMGTKPIRL